MTPSQDLFNLIKSMTAHEKRYFKLFTSRHTINENNNTIRLYDCIAHMENYDEELVKKHFKGETFIKHLPSEKNYLTHLILRSLEGFHTKSEAEFELYSRFSQIKIVYDKGLYPICEKLIEKNIKQATEIEDSVLLLLSLKWQIKLLRLYPGLQHINEKNIELPYDKIFHLLTNVADEFKLSKIDFDIAYKSFKKAPRTQADLNYYLNILKDEALNVDENELNYSSRFNYYTIRMLIAHISSDIKNRLLYLEKLTGLIESNRNTKNKSQLAYANLLYNTAWLLITEKKFGKALETIDKLKTLTSDIENRKTVFLSYSLRSELFYYTETKNFNSFNNLLPELKKLFRLENNPLLVNQLNLQIAFCFFWFKKFKEARLYLNKILNENTPDKSSDMYTRCMLLLLLINVESDSEDFLASSAKSVARFLIRQNRFYDVEKIILRFIIKNLNELNSNSKEMSAKWLQLGKQIDNEMKNPLTMRFFLDFDLLKWALSKTK